MENTLKFTLLVGLKDKDTKKQIISRSKASSIIEKIVGDCTISEATGYYTHDNGEKVKENSLRVEILFKSTEEVLVYCNSIKKE